MVNSVVLLFTSDATYIPKSILSLISQRQINGVAISVSFLLLTVPARELTANQFYQHQLIGSRRQLCLLFSLKSEFHF